ncbi:MAG: alpha/beta hydrolase, partial [Gemmatimonadetes bacterium]|nr:alpha/beta hydrolase [Gemmatimonadota bacterium]
TSYFPEQARRIMRASHPDSVPARLDALARTHSRGKEQAHMLLTQFHAFKDSYDDMNFTAPLLSTIQARTLIVHGDRDQFFPVSIPAEQYEAIPRSYLWIIPNGGHVPFPRTEAGRQAFAETVTAFLRGEWR